jgi:hypothetical protein
MNDWLVLTLTALATVVAGLRFALAGHPRLCAAAVLVMAAVPWAASDRLAATSESAVAARVAVAETGRTLSLLVVAEALVAGASGLRLLADTSGRERPALATAAALSVPSPSLVLGIMGTQILLYNRTSGQSFDTLTITLSVGVLAALGLVAGLAVFRLSSVRRAELLVLASAAMLIVGAFLPLLLRPPVTRTMAARFNPQATLLVPLVGLAVVGLGYLAHLGRAVLDRRVLP